ncbi:hypothetical protein O6H91_22G034700 [Diphasiastrum complanatum]|uniref:Uncharacterized protein n=1 Tax=Diphasiastrum complanatum TaxID=34168 RepID=A0ACC2AEB8_DIPCM|nr:hypothetical protein O6H91_22G034700 [Diphasiastrum complanatum]
MKTLSALPAMANPSCSSPVQLESGNMPLRLARPRIRSLLCPSRNFLESMTGLKNQGSLCSRASTFNGRMLWRVVTKTQLFHRPKLSEGQCIGKVSAAVKFPADYSQLLEQVKAATEAALADSKQLLEIEFPTAGLTTVPGDIEGGIEMSNSMELVRYFCQSLFGGEKASSTRIFFPDVSEVELAKKSIFEGCVFKLDYLSSPSGLEDIGFGKKVRMSDRAKSTDKTFIIAYPYFNVNEMLAVEELFRDVAKINGCPIIVFNGELDRIRSGYYPSFFYPRLGALSKTFLPEFETVYYIHNFKGRNGGTLFRVYPGPWQVICNTKGQLVCIHEQENMPTLKEVALNILPSASV